MDEEDQRLLSAAHAAVRENQRKLHSLSEEARLLYQRRLSEWEQCRTSLEQLATLLNSQPVSVSGNHQQAGNSKVRTGLLRQEALLREKHGELAEDVYRLQRASRLLGTSIRHLEQESARLLQDGDAFLRVRDQEEPQSENHDRIIQAYEQERLRLAREIHDGPAQILANAIFELEYFERLIDRDPTSVKGQLSQLKRDIRDGLTEVRRFIFDLRPPALNEMGLFVALRRYLEDYEKHFAISVQTQLPDSRERLSATKEMALFRIVQEALQNVQKHAHASRVTVMGEIDSVVLRVTVEDNGRGFDLAEVASRQSRNFGLISMRERAGLANAQLHITSSPGQGTRIAVVAALDHGGN